MITSIICDQCKGQFECKNNSLFCSNCDLSINRNSASFFDFRGETETSQEKGLRSDMHMDFYANDAYQEFNKALSNDSVQYFIKNFKLGKVLEVGCGTGEMRKYLHNYGEYYGLDPSNIINQTLPEQDKDKVFLIHNDVSKGIPIKDESIDSIFFFASYDHIPEPKEVIIDAWSKLKPGGHMLINMTNYGFWLKQLINKVTGKQLFKNEEEHYCVHNPQSLINEISSFLGKDFSVGVDADFVNIPNLPKKLSFYYFNISFIKLNNFLLRLLFYKIFRMKNRGSIMTVVFRKDP